MFVHSAKTKREEKGQGKKSKTDERKTADDTKWTLEFFDFKAI